MTDTWLALENKIVVVTGGASGIGKHVVEGLLRAGAKVAVFDVAVENGVQSSSGAHFFRVDITDPDSVEQAVSSVVEELGEITTLVNNAGINLPACSWTRRARSRRVSWISQRLTACSR